MTHWMKAEQYEAAVSKPNRVVLFTRWYRFTAAATRRSVDAFEKQIVCRGCGRGQLTTAQFLERLRDAVLQLRHGPNNIDETAGAPRAERHMVRRDREASSQI